MKSLIVALGLLCLSTPVFSCANWMPEAAAVLAIENNGVGDLPLRCNLSTESCVCYDTTEWNGEWFVAVITTRYVDDKALPIYPFDCPSSRPECSPVGYEQKAEGKKIVNDSDKLSVFAAAKEQEAVAAKATRQDRLDARERLKSLCSGVDSAANLAQVKAAVKACLIDLIKATRD